MAIWCWWATEGYLSVQGQVALQYAQRNGFRGRIATEGVPYRGAIIVIHDTY